jgi:hypothetical protein
MAVDKFAERNIFHKLKRNLTGFDLPNSKRILFIIPCDKSDPCNKILQGFAINTCESLL